MQFSALFCVVFVKFLVLTYCLYLTIIHFSILYELLCSGILKLQGTGLDYKVQLSSSKLSKEILSGIGLERDA